MKKINIVSFKDSVKIKFNGSVKKKNVVEMVERCQNGQCKCMSEESKKKIENLEISDEKGRVELIISGKLNKQEIEDALSRSPLIEQ